MKNQYAKDIYLYHRRKLEEVTAAYNSAREGGYDNLARQLAEQLWRDCFMAEIFAVIASKLDKQGRDYWRMWMEGIE